MGVIPIFLIQHVYFHDDPQESKVYFVWDLRAFLYVSVGVILAWQNCALFYWSFHYVAIVLMALWFL